METSTSPVRRILFVALLCLAVTLAWVAVTLLVGGSHANAAERPIDLIEELTAQTSANLSDVVEPLDDATTGAVTAIIDEVAAPVVEHAVTAASATVTATTQTTGRAVEPTVSAVDSVPVIGSSVATTASNALGATTDAVQHTLATTVRVIEPVTDLLSDSPVGSVVDPIVHLLPPVDGVPAKNATGFDPSSEAGVSLAADARTASAATNSALLHVFAFAPTEQRSSAPDAATGPLGDADPPLGASSPPGAPFGSNNTTAPPPPSSAAPGAHSSGSAAVVAGTESPTLHGWQQANPPQNEVLPLAPAFDTDVSPG